jgi:hypothetical protein
MCWGERYTIENVQLQGKVHIEEEKHGLPGGPVEAAVVGGVAAEQAYSLHTRPLRPE